MAGDPGRDTKLKCPIFNLNSSCAATEVGWQPSPWNAFRIAEPPLVQLCPLLSDRNIILATGARRRVNKNIFQSESLPALCRESVDQRQPVETLAEAPREIVDPALPAQAAPLPELLHRHALNQNLMHQRGAVGAEFALGTVQPQHGLALALRNRLPRLPAIDIFPRRIDGLRAALGLLPVVLKRPAALILRLVDLTMRMQPAQGIVADRAQRDDFFSRLQAQGIVHFNRRHLRVAQQIPRSPVMNLFRSMRLVAFGPCHV